METRSRHKNFRSRHSSIMVRRSHVATEFICVATGNGDCESGKLVVIRHNARDRGTLPRTIETLYRTRQRRSIAHNRAGRAQQACTCDWDANTTEARVRQRYSSVTDLYRSQKKRPPKLGRHSLVSELRYTNT